jgi:hypothetical protein
VSLSSCVGMWPCQPLLLLLLCHSISHFSFIHTNRLRVSSTAC